MSNTATKTTKPVTTKAIITKILAIKAQKKGKNYTKAALERAYPGATALLQEKVAKKSLRGEDKVVAAWLLS